MCASDFTYTSGNNSQWMTIDEMRGWLKQEYGITIA
jgi:hypothetical protein